MAVFAKAPKQAADVMKQLQGKYIKSVSTVANYEKSLTRVAEWVKENRISKDGLQGITKDDAIQYLEQRGEAVGQKTLDMERQAIQAMFTHLTKQLESNERLPVIKSEHQQILKGRAYTKEQAGLVSRAQQQRNSLSTQIAYAAGLRAHELYTLRPLSERDPSDRPALATKFNGREGERYTVDGKGGLIRIVLIPGELAKQLEAVRLETPVNVTDRGVYYRSHYNVSGGNVFSSSFTRAAQRSLGWSEGAHGLRHSYAQERVDEIQKLGHSYPIALETVSQEMGHFRPEITEVYLR